MLHSARGNKVGKSRMKKDVSRATSTASRTSLPGQFQCICSKVFPLSRAEERVVDKNIIRNFNLPIDLDVDLSASTFSVARVYVVYPQHKRFV